MKIILVDAWNTLITENGIYMEMYNMLEKFDEKKIILSNANKNEQLEFGMVNLPYDFFSLEHQPNKSNPKYFKLLIKKFDYNPNSLIYFDHDIAAIDSARSIGITSCYYNSKEKNVFEIQEFIQLNINK